MIYSSLPHGKAIGDFDDEPGWYSGAWSRKRITHHFQFARSYYDLTLHVPAGTHPATIRSLHSSKTYNYLLTIRTTLCLD